MHDVGISSRPARRVLLETKIGFYSESNFYTGFDGSEPGVFVATYSFQPVGTPVELHVELPGGFEFEATGTVRWVRDPLDDDTQPGMGIVLERLGDYAMHLIAAFLGVREPQFYA